MFKAFLVILLAPFAMLGCIVLGLHHIADNQFGYVPIDIAGFVFAAYLRFVAKHTVRVR